MTIRRTVPDIKSDQSAQSREFYADFLGVGVEMERDDIVTFASPTNRTAQISVLRPESNIPHPNISIEVAEVNAKAKEQDIEIVYPLTDEPWGVCRFFSLDPNRAVINILSHN